VTNASVIDAIDHSDQTLELNLTAVSLRELHAALLAARAAQVPCPHTARLSTTPTAAIPTAARMDDLPTGGDSRSGGRLSPPPLMSEPAATQLTLLATHGGAGARCLATVLGATEVHHSWPTAVEPNPITPVPVLLVCRSNARGLTSAQQFAREHRDSTGARCVRLLGCAVVPDAPGRLPVGLRRLQRLLTAAVPRLWTVPWMPAWRLAPPDPGQPPEWASRLRDELGQVMAR